jgi:hypothetical protein
MLVKYSREIVRLPPTSMEPAKLIRKLREERFVKAIEIERISRSIADVKKNPDFYVQDIQPCCLFKAAL